MRTEQPEDTETLAAIQAALADAADGASASPAESGNPRDTLQAPAPHLKLVVGDDARREVISEPVAPSNLAGPEARASADASGTPDTLSEEAAIASVLAGERHGPALGARLSAEWALWRPLRPYIIATLAPVPLLMLAAFAGGIASLVALVWMTGVLYAIDEVLKRRGITGPEPLRSETTDRLSVLLGGVHFVLLFLAVWALAGGGGLGVLGWIATLLAYGLWFGQVSNSNAHELIHRGDRRLFRLGMWIYISLLFGHHTSAHRLVHHRFVATTDDPNTAAEGEGFWSFAARAWPGAFVAGYEMEEHRRAKQVAGGFRALNPYTVYVAGAAGFAALMLTLFGFDGLLAYVLLCGHAQLQLLLSDYVQHYGLLRRNLPSGALEPAGVQHSWDAPHPFSAMMMLNAPHHADHHVHPSRPWPELRLSPKGKAPLLPYSLPVMASIAMVPALWHRVMDRRLSRLRALAAAH